MCNAGFTNELNTPSYFMPCAETRKRHQAHRLRLLGLSADFHDGGGTPLYGLCRNVQPQKPFTNYCMLTAIYQWSELGN